MQKSPEAFRTISEVADALEVPAHVLRFWESRFTQIRPVKRAGGRRYYRPADIELLAAIRKLLHDDGMTIRGVQKRLREEGVRAVAQLGVVSSPGALPGVAAEVAPAAVEGPPEATPAPAAPPGGGFVSRRAEKPAEVVQVPEEGAAAPPPPAKDAPPAPAVSDREEPAPRRPSNPAVPPDPADDDPRFARPARTRAAARLDPARRRALHASLMALRARFDSAGTTAP